jgi:hypothetical protein
MSAVASITIRFVFPNQRESSFIRSLHPLAWVADPNRLSNEERQTALEFLIENSEQQPSPYEYELNERFDETGAVGYPFFYWKTLGFSNRLPSRLPDSYSSVWNCSTRISSSWTRRSLSFYAGERAAEASLSREGERRTFAAIPAVVATGRKKIRMSMRRTCANIGGTPIRNRHHGQHPSAQERAD